MATGAADYALITGASSGLGAEFARQLAGRGYNLILAARREDRLEALKAEIEALPGSTKIEVIVSDLSTEDGPQREAVSLQCEECREEVFKYEFDATPHPDADTISHPFPSLTVSAKAMTDYNSATANRTCPKCGHVNAPFPLRDWGWEAYVDQSATVHDGVGALRDAAGQLSSD